MGSNKSTDNFRNECTQEVSLRGISKMAYISEKRVEMAKNLLKMEGKTIPWFDVPSGRRRHNARRVSSDHESGIYIISKELSAHVSSFHVQPETVQNDKEKIVSLSADEILSKNATAQSYEMYHRKKCPIFRGRAIFIRSITEFSLVLSLFEQIEMIADWFCGHLVLQILRLSN